MDTKATAAALGVSSAIRAQIRQLRERDGVGIADISQMLGIPELIIEEVLGSHGAAAPSTDESVLTERAASIEDSLADKITDAVSTLHELTIGAESEAVRAISAQRILEYATGGLRPKKSQQPAVHVTVDTMNILIQKAAEQYQKMLSEVPKQAEVFSAQLN